MNIRTNGESDKLASMMHDALEKVFQQTRAANVPDVRYVRLTVRTDPQIGRHVHATASVRLRFDACVTERSVMEEPVELA